MIVSNKMLSGNLLRDRLTSSMWSNLLFQPTIMVLSLASSVVVARLLGPELIAVIAMISTVSATVTVFSDLGITKSIAKIMPDIGIRYGGEAAIHVQQRLTLAKLCMVCLGLLGLFLMYRLRKWGSWEGLMSGVWFFPLVTAQAVLGTVLVIQQHATGAAFRNPLLARLTLFTTIFGPLLSIGAVLIWRNPYIVVATTLIPNLVHLILLRAWGGYDLDCKANNTGHLSFHWLFKEYHSFMSVTYLLFLFNRFVYGLPLTLWLLTWFGAGANIIGNVAIAVSIVGRSWDTANIPLTNLRAPLLARLHAMQDAKRFRQIQQLMVAIVVLTSGTLSIIMLSVGPWLFGVLYGTKYYTGVSWGIVAGVVALLGNFFSLGNSTLHQTNRFRPELIGVAIGAAVILVNLVVILPLVPKENWPLAIILGYVLGRTTFWILTDLWTDSKIFRWKGSRVKVSGLLAVSIALGAILGLTTLGTIGQFIALPIALLLFFGVFRISGGVGSRMRTLIGELLGTRLQWVARLI